MFNVTCYKKLNTIQNNKIQKQKRVATTVILRDVRNKHSRYFDEREWRR